MEAGNQKCCRSRTPVVVLLGSKCYCFRARAVVSVVCFVSHLSDLLSDPWKKKIIVLQTYKHSSLTVSDKKRLNVGTLHRNRVQ